MNSGTHMQGTGDFNGAGSPRAVLSMWVDTIELSTVGPKPDIRWRFTDRAGHAHAYSLEDDHYPTLYREDVLCESTHEDGDAWWCECRTKHLCRICHAEVAPGMTAGGGEVERRPGMKRWSVVLDYIPGRPVPEIGAMGTVWFSVNGKTWFGVAVASEVHTDSEVGSRVVFTGASSLGRAA